MVGNFVLWRRASGAVKRNLRPQISQTRCHYETSLPTDRRLFYVAGGTCGKCTVVHFER